MFVNLFRSGRINRYLGMDPGLADELPFANQYTCVRLPATRVTSLTTGDPVEGTEIAARTKIVLESYEVRAEKNAILVEPNPILFEYGQVQNRFTIRYEDGKIRPAVYFRPDKNFSLNDLDWIVQLSVYSEGT